MLFRSLFVAVVISGVHVVLNLDPVLAQSCSVDAPCPEDKFCNFDFGSSGVCEDCPRFVSGLPCSDQGLPSGGVDDCESACADSQIPHDCSVDAPCPEDEFCNYDDGSSGFCEGCDRLIPGLPCSHQGLPPGGVEDCESACAGSEPEPPELPPFELPPSPFAIFPVDDAGGCEVPTEKSSRMKSLGLTKVACPFSVLVAGTTGFADARLKFAANVIANILDQDADGAADDPDVLQALTYRGKARGGALLQCGVSQEEEQRGDELSGGVFDYAFSCQTWKSQSVADFKGILMEEAFHLVHQLGYAIIFPDELGMKDYTSSVVGREAARLQCVAPGWIHPENTCPADSPRPPGDPAPSPLPGTCSSPSCDIAEFYKMVLFLSIGMGEWNDPGGPSVWLSEYMPGIQDEVLSMLSAEFKEMINTPSLHQLSAPLTGEYKESGGNGKGKGKGKGKNKGKTGKASKKRDLAAGKTRSPFA